MMEKLKVNDVLALEFVDADQVYKFSDLYQFTKVMGYGGFGIVVAAKDRKTGKNVALKIVDKSDTATDTHVQMLKHEA